MSAARAECFAPVVRQLSTLATKATLLLAGAGATPEIVARAHARPLPGDPVEAAERLSLERVGMAATPRNEAGQTLNSWDYRGERRGSWTHTPF